MDRLPKPTTILSTSALPNYAASDSPMPKLQTTLELKVLPRAQKTYQNHLLKQCWCAKPRHLDLAEYLWNPPASPWYAHEGCNCGGSCWVCATCNGLGWVQDKGAQICRDCRERI